MASQCDRYATAESAALAQLPPHAFKTARACYEVLRSTGAPQAVLISGESGAGKTETARLCLQCLTLSSGSGGSVVQALLECSVLMESLGNARTLHNDNSSRFGKWLALTFGRAGTISGARAQCFLLEQSRVAALQPGERNFHAIHALVAGASDAEAPSGACRRPPTRRRPSYPPTRLRRHRRRAAAAAAAASSAAAHARRRPPAPRRARLPRVGRRPPDHRRPPPPRQHIPCDAADGEKVVVAADNGGGGGGGGGGAATAARRSVARPACSASAAALQRAALR